MLLSRALPRVGEEIERLAWIVDRIGRSHRRLNIDRLVPVQVCHFLMTGLKKEAGCSVNSGIAVFMTAPVG